MWLEMLQRPRHRTDAPVVIDWGGSLADEAGELRLRLAMLAEERVLARESGLVKDAAYREDLELEQTEVRTAYAGAAVLQIAQLRAELDGRNTG